MLQTSMITTTEPLVRPRKPRSPLLSITGQSLSKGSRQPWERALLAGHWVCGRLEFKPTAAIASTVFRVSIQLIRRAVAEIKAREAATDDQTDEIEKAWARSDELERDAFVRAHFDELFAHLDRLTH